MNCSTWTSKIRLQSTGKCWRRQRHRICEQVPRLAFPAVVPVPACEVLFLTKFDTREVMELYSRVLSDNTIQIDSKIFYWVLKFPNFLLFVSLVRCWILWCVRRVLLCHAQRLTQPFGHFYIEQLSSSLTRVSLIWTSDQISTKGFAGSYNAEKPGERWSHSDFMVLVACCWWSLRVWNCWLDGGGKRNGSEGV